MTPQGALRLLAARARRNGLPPPAALIGEWFRSRAVVVPSVRVHPAHNLDTAFGTPAVQPEIVGAAPGAVGGGWIGYLGYGLTDPSARAGWLPPAAWGWADHVLRLDLEGTWWFEALVAPGTSMPVAQVREYESLLVSEPGDDDRPMWTPVILDRPHRARHRAAVRCCIEAIVEGELFQANICTRFRGVFDGDPSNLFAEGSRSLGPRLGAFVAGDWGAVVSLSPELFIQRRGRRVRSSPIKGTLPRRGPSDDANAQRLRLSVKDVAENIMITDLVRNDLGKVSQTGSVSVPALLVVRKAPGVWHLESTIEARVGSSIDDAALLRATFPPGSVTGAPKLRALELIAELEPQPRGVYCGAVGLASPIAGTELNVAIRTFELCPDQSGRYQLELGVGGGITADSDADAEWEECLHKAAPLEDLLAARNPTLRR